MDQQGTNDWNARYSESDRLFSAKPNEALVELVQGITPGSALDLGAGEGRNSLWLAANGWDVTAVDISDVALARLEKFASEQNVEVHTVVGDMETFLSQGQRFDLVVMAYIQLTSVELKSIFAAASDAVSPGGHMFIVGHHIASLGKGGPPQPERLYTDDTFSNLLPSMELIVNERQERSTNDLDVPLVDAVAWAVKPVDSTQ